MPKRVRTSSSSSFSSDSGGEADNRNVLDVHKFVNLSAQHYFWNILLGKSFVPERGLKPSPQDGRMLGQIRSRGWALFVDTPSAAPMAVVREFYANGRETQNGISYVRGRQVSYTPQAINDLFKLPTPTPEVTEWTQKARFQTDLDVLVEEMCRPDTRWKTKAGTDKKVHFPQTALSKYAKAWYSFICGSILPTSHHQDVTVERAVVLYGIVKGLSMDLGFIINQSMLRFMRASTSGGIPHASVITRLCLAAQVDWSDETLQMPMRDIDHTVIEKYTIWTGMNSDPRGLGFTAVHDVDEEDVAVHEPQAVGPPMDYVARQDRQLRRLQRRMDVMHADFRSYTSEFSEALTRAFAQLGTDAQFPSFGTSGSYPPPDTPPEEGTSAQDARD